MGKKLIDVFPQFLTTGAIFKAFETYLGETTPWTSLSALNLDIAYIGEHSGDKFISPLLTKLLSSDGSISSANLEVLAKVIYQKYKVQWAKLYATLTAQYNPIENYSMTETMDRDTANTGTSSHAISGSSSETITHGKTVTSSGNADVYGFNSTAAVPVSETGMTDSESGTTGTSESTSGSDIRTDNLAATEDYTLTRSGNIGVTTTQQMIESEITLWSWNIWEQIFKDIDQMLTIGIYE